MVYTNLKLSAKECSSFLPRYVCTLMSQPNVMSIGAEDPDGKICAIAVFCREPLRPDEVTLLYFYVAEKHRGKGLCQELLRHCIDVLKGRGVRCINCKVCGEVPFLHQVYDHLLKLRFIPVTFQGHLMTYETAELAADQGVGRLILVKDKLPGAVSLIDEMDPRLLRFAQKANRRGFTFDVHRYDKALSKFYQRGNEILGAMTLERMDDHTVFLGRMYVDPAIPSEVVVPVLLANVLYEVQQHMPADSKILMQIFDDQVYSALLTVLGKGHDELTIQEYVRALNR